MKKFILICTILMSAIANQAQVYYNESFHSIDTNGPMGECLLPMNEEDDVFFSDVVTCDSSSIDDIMNAAQNWLAFQQMDANLEVEEKYAGKNMLQFKGKLPVGKKIYWNSSDINFR